MLTYLLDVGDLADARFVVSPLNETALSLFHLNRARPTAGHLAGWRRAADARGDEYDRALIDALVSPSGKQIPDFLTPVTAQAEVRPSFEAHLDAVRGTDTATVRAELAELAEGDAPSLELARLIALENPAPVIADALAAYHRAAVAPVWPAVQRILESDVVFRGRELAVGGPTRLFGSLSPRVEWRRTGELSVDMACSVVAGEIRSPGLGLTLMPSVFTTRITTAHDPTRTAPHIGYPARGSATLAETSPPVADDALRRLIGAAKADLLAALDEPAAVVDLARALGVSPSAISQSLKVLGANGIVESSRYGRRVLYRRTALGDALVDRRKEGPHGS
ncbi:helix-turn-helix domain-containing protein [Tsukamurella spumae]|uniref:Helix-turn-helix transcriptional regulator n=1 Tax=Tsukamurella spumae TaxID=44753 RepID=A0A846X6I5_9ACTN|nr:helix-turn-helix domain-containing protein [Tsukamurella spumae]NKY20195.1 helix-turn-helix transcriptional regulator [Tsukamurella spumae]